LSNQYLQLVHNERVNGKVRQQILATLGRLDVLQRSGQIDALVASCGRFAQHTAVLDAHRHGRTEAVATMKIGPCLVFDERLWKGLGLPEIQGALLAGRRFGFAVERAVFLTVLHQLFDPGSDRAAEVWRAGYAIPGTEELEAWFTEKPPTGLEPVTCGLQNRGVCDVTACQHATSEICLLRWVQNWVQLFDQNAELMHVASIWKRLPKAIRDAILTMVRTIDESK